MIFGNLAYRLPTQVHGALRIEKRDARTAGWAEIRSRISRMILQSGNVLGVKVHAVNLPRAVEVIEHLIQEGSRAYICLAPAHSIMECHRDPELRRIFNDSALVTPDGMSIAWILRLQSHMQVGRVYGPDLMRAVLGDPRTSRFRHFLFGSTDRVLSRLKEQLVHDYPGSRIAGSLAPPYLPVADLQDQTLFDQINDANPEIVWVGLGSPKQERWMAAHRNRLTAPVLIGVGAAFDFLSGAKAQAPRWMQRAGLEWLFRLATEPRRLWPRYRQYPLFVLLVLAQFLGLRNDSVAQSGS